MDISKERIEEFKRIFEKEYGKKLTDEEAYESAHNLLGFFEVLYTIYIREQGYKRKLKESPRGFSLEGNGQYVCPVCGRYTIANEMWYDRYGQKCITYQKAIDKKIIPGSVCKNKDSWYSTWEFYYYFKIKTPTVNKLVRQSIIKARVIPEINCSIFLIKDNTDVLPSKKLLKSRLVRFEENRYGSQNWYEFQDPVEVLRGYKVVEYSKYLKQISETYKSN